MGDSVDAMLAVAKAHESAGRIPAALVVYEQALVADPEHPIALWRIAEHELARGSAATAAEHLGRALGAAQRRGIPTREFWFALGRANMAQSKAAAAADAFRNMLEAAPRDAVAYLGLGAAALAGGDPVQAERVLREAVAVHPGLAGAWANLAVALSGQQRLAEALECAKRAVQLAPNSVAACQILAATAIHGGDAAVAIPACRAALVHAPGHPVLVAALADALKSSGARDEARSLLVPLLSVPQPAVNVLVSFGALCVETGRFSEAVPALERALVADPRNPRAWDNLGTAHKRSGQIERAALAFAQAVEFDPKLTPAMCNLTDALREACDWDRLAEVEAGWHELRKRPDLDQRWNPFVALRDESTASQQLEITRAWSRHTLPPVAASARSAAIVRSRDSRLRIGYLSSDLQEHATARLMAGLFEHHDLSRFETFAYSCAPDDGSAMRQRLLRAFEHWSDVTHLDDAAAAHRIRDDGIDVLIDLKGHTQDNRLGILCHRPASVQIHYLGYPGTLGFDAVSHLVADAVTVPDGEDVHYHESVLRMPRCYQVNDDRRALPPAVPRSALGLPEGGLVVACFNQSYKLSRRFFAAWIEALQGVPDAVLWLYAPQEVARANLRRQAQRLGFSAERLLFAPAIGNDEHIARLRSVDLALDVLPCGSHTTGSDALWAGVPLLACRGTTFAGRVAASLLGAVELPELVAESFDSYCEKLQGLVRERERLREYRHHLDTERSRLQLFATEAYTRDFERMVEALAIAR